MTPELLAPAGSPEALDAAIGEGADAVYLGLKNFNARMRSANFAYSQFEGALKTLHRAGKKIYVTVNTVFEQREADRMYQLLKYLSVTGADAVIVQDLGVLAMAHSRFPSLKIHASTQMNIASSRGANLLSRYGVSRAVLARELGFAELKDIREKTNMELEVFVHGALCVSASGLCLFSSYLGGKSANRGLCTQACRRFYRRKEGGGAGYYFSPGDLQLPERIPALAAAGINSFKIEGRMKSADYVGVVVRAYRLVLDAVQEGGEEKIERSIKEARGMLLNDFARAKTTFYFDAPDLPAPAPPATAGLSAAVPPAAPGLDWLNPAQDGGTGLSLGTLLKVKGAGDGRRGLVSREDFADASYLPAAGDSVRLHRRDDSERAAHKLRFVEAENEGVENGAAGSSDGKGRFWISLPEGFEPGDRVYLIQTKAAARRYAPVIPRSVGDFRRTPGREKAPFPELPCSRRNDAARASLKHGQAAPFPEGLYVSVSRIEDLYVVQSSRPVKVMLSYTRKSAAALLSGGRSLPFKPEDLILTLDPYFPQAQAEITAEEIGGLIKSGYRQFVVNNPGHLSLFRGSGGSAGNSSGDRAVSLLAGPWLYIFNSWALSFIASLGLEGFISPYENNRQNLERTFSFDSGQERRPEKDDGEKPRMPPGGRKASLQRQDGAGRRGGSARHRGLTGKTAALRSLVFVPVFAWPSLFRIRADLGALYDFDEFSDSRGEDFFLITGPEGSLVVPEKPFSITDKIPFLEQAGFKRFIIDLTGPVLKKGLYRDLIRSVKEGVPLSGVSRFNWKNGFYQAKENV
ncbi:MAG: U32 family peptidase [Treponema sp.]|jgi:putative protease|nr:U32 family peptidase [Treponema sp.]